MDVASRTRVRKMVDRVSPRGELSTQPRLRGFVTHAIAPGDWRILRAARPRAQVVLCWRKQRIAADGCLRFLRCIVGDHADHQKPGKDSLSALTMSSAKAEAAIPIKGGEGTRMVDGIRLKRIDTCPCAVVRRLATPTELSKVVPEACGIVWSVIRAQSVEGAGRNLAIYLDDKINLEVGVELEASFAGHGEVVRSFTPAGLVATTTHFGPYGRLREAYQALHEWCRLQGHTPAGPSWEVYGHWSEEWNSNPSRIQTDVFVLLSEPST